MVRNFVLSKVSCHPQNPLARGRWRHKPEGAFNIYHYKRGDGRRETHFPSISHGDRGIVVNRKPGEREKDYDQGRIDCGSGGRGPG
jgi:hypothetical protein